MANAIGRKFIFGLLILLVMIFEVNTLTLKEVNGNLGKAKNPTLNNNLDNTSTNSTRNEAMGTVKGTVIEKDKNELNTLEKNVLL